MSHYLHCISYHSLEGKEIYLTQNKDNLHISPAESHHFFKIDQLVNERLVALVSECHVWK